MVIYTALNNHLLDITGLVSIILLGQKLCQVGKYKIVKNILKIAQ